MGKSAKLHKRVPKKSGSSSTQSTAQGGGGQSQQQQNIQAAKKRANIKSKAGKGGTSTPGQPILGGADYVSLMMGGRRKAREEAKKLPKDE